MVVLDSHGVGSRSKRVPVVMLHGFPDNALSFYAVAPLLVARGHRVILPSLPGYDATSVSEDVADKSMERLAQDITVALGKLELGEGGFHLVGHVGLFLARSFPSPLS